MPSSTRTQEIMDDFVVSKDDAIESIFNNIEYIWIKLSNFFLI